MSEEFKLSYTANEIDEKLGKIDSLVATVNGITPDENGNVAIEVGGGNGSSAIIDVTELPIENISDDAFYRLTTCKLVFNQVDCTENDYICYCVDGLPETGLAATNAEMSIINSYYNIQDGMTYGYVDDVLSSMLGFSVGWYDIASLLAIANTTFSGVISDISDDPCDDSLRVLLSKDFYIYQDDWCKLPFAYEKAPEYEIQWDGVIGDRMALDMSLLGYEQGVYFVKVSDDIFTTNKLIGWTLKIRFDDGSCDEYTISSLADFDTTTYPGAFTIVNYIVIVHDEDQLNTALGMPSGTLTNGIYFWLYLEHGHMSQFVAPSKITKIDKKYLDMSSLGLHSVATTGDYNDLWNRPMALCYDARYTLNSQYQKNVRDTINVYSKSEVDSKISSGVNLTGYAKTTDVENMISDAIGYAIGGSY